ncbi:HlyC/CorC family transporter [Ramlibacter sp. AW1]|uniref:HlyC/CorC family transporter n=1 Tax=Ramlibacter aurantiacus TaxID=2801330 RepID=A0A936ZND2_9BURK|nr:hemolysin family protein [Ramlibacter aurantiacus]MBL0422927.1 HlyC/CorC family transporter [Ramlibacter aurantiacus]
MEILLIAVLTLLNGVFAMSELALASSRKARLTPLAAEGDPGAKAALQLIDQPTQFLSTVQVGITSIGVLNGIVGQAAFSADLAAWMAGLGLSEGASDILATVLVVAIITYVTIIFGELVPKRIGQLYPETITRWVARPMAWLASGAKPFVWALSASTQAMLKLLRIDTDQPRAITEEEIAHSLAEGVDAGLIEQHERQMVQNLFHLDERRLTSLMIPRSEIEWLDANLSVAECLQRAGREDGHSWYPVCRGSLDHVLGVVSISKLLALGPQHEGPVSAHVVPATFLPETLSGMELLEQFRLRVSRLVLVVDEYGVVQGMMTPLDLLEGITGELTPVESTEAWATRRDDGSWLLDGTMPVAELKARLAIRELPDEERGRYNTLAGLLMSESGTLPAVGERIECAGWSFEVVDLDGKRIDKVLAVFVPPPAPPPTSSDE